MSQKNEIIGAIFPLNRDHSERIFEAKKNVFVKFSPFNLSVGQKLVFYVSREKVFIGKATICKVRKMTPKEVWEEYGDRLFLSQAELEEYASFSKIENKKRSVTELSVYELGNISRFKKPVAAFFQVTASGRYLDSDLLAKIENRERNAP